METDLEIASSDPGGPGLEAAGAIEFALTGHRRTVDYAFLAGLRPLWIARRAGAVVGFAYGVTADGDTAGPIGVLDPADLAALLKVVENDAAARAIEEFALLVPLDATVAVGHLLERGARIDTFYLAILTDDPWLPTDRWILTGPGYLI